MGWVGGCLRGDSARARVAEFAEPDMRIIHHPARARVAEFAEPDMRIIHHPARPRIILKK